MEFDLRGAPVQIGIYFDDVHPEVGGVSTYVAELLGVFSEMAAASEHNYIILCPPIVAHATRLKVGALKPNITVVAVPPPSWLARLLRRLKYFSPLFRMVWRGPGAIERVARHHNVHLLWFAGGGICECPDMPYVATLWDLQHRYQPFFPEVSAAGIWDVREQFFSYFLRRAAYCVTGTETGKREIQYLYQLAEPRVQVLPLPTPTFAMDAAPSTIDVRTHFGIDKKYIFYPAQFWPHKNHVNLILALKWLKEQRGLEILLVFCGSDKGNLSFIKRFVEQQGMADQVRFLGFVSKEELVALYRQAMALTFVTYFGPDNIPRLRLLHWAARLSLLQWRGRGSSMETLLFMLIRRIRKLSVRQYGTCAQTRGCEKSSLQRVLNGQSGGRGQTISKECSNCSMNFPLPEEIGCSSRAGSL